MPLGTRSRNMKRPGVRLSRCSMPQYLSREFMSAFSTSSQVSEPSRIFAANSYTSVHAEVGSLASLAFSIGLPSLARSIASSGRNSIPVCFMRAGRARGAEFGMVSAPAIAACIPAMAM
eukprot:scaffold264052_cov30-Tisochrysis_lutea.AAC.4